MAVHCELFQMCVNIPLSRKAVHLKNHTCKPSLQGSIAFKKVYLKFKNKLFRNTCCDLDCVIWKFSLLQLSRFY